MWNRTCRDLLRLFLLSPAVRLVLATLIRRPGYMNVAYYAAGAVRLTQGNGLSQPFLWNYLDDLAGSVAAVVLCMQIIRWRPRPWLWAATTLWCVLMYHDLQALILGQFAVFVLLALVAALWAMQRGCDGWAGFFLALSTVKPQMVYLAIPWILLWAAVERRWRLWRGFGEAMAALMLGSLALVPSWPLEFTRQVMGYSSYAVYGSLTWMIVQLCLGWGTGAEIAVATRTDSNSPYSSRPDLP